MNSDLKTILSKKYGIYIHFKLCKRDMISSNQLEYKLKIDMKIEC